MKRRSGFTLVEISIVVSVIGLLAAVAIPSLNSARSNSLDRTKKSNVRVLNNAVEMWAMDVLAPDRTRIGIGVTNYIKGGFESLSVGESPLNITNITQKTVGYTFTIDDLY